MRQFEIAHGSNDFSAISASCPRVLSRGKCSSNILLRVDFFAFFLVISLRTLRLCVKKARFTQSRQERKGRKAREGLHRVIPIQTDQLPIANKTFSFFPGKSYNFRNGKILKKFRKICEQFPTMEKLVWLRLAKRTF